MDIVAKDEKHAFTLLVACKGPVVLLWILYIFGQWLCSLDINTLFISIYPLEPYLLHCTQNNPIDVVWFCLV